MRYRWNVSVDWAGAMAVWLLGSDPAVECELKTSRIFVYVALVATTRGSLRLGGGKRSCAQKPRSYHRGWAAAAISERGGCARESGGLPRRVAGAPTVLRPRVALGCVGRCPWSVPPPEEWAPGRTAHIKRALAERRGRRKRARD